MKSDGLPNGLLSNDGYLVSFVLLYCIKPAKEKTPKTSDDDTKREKCFFTGNFMIQNKIWVAG